jgi:hypothetical protein
VKESLYAVQQRLRRLWPFKILGVLRTPRFELDSLPTRWQMLGDDGKCSLELATTQHVGVQVSPLACIGTEDPAAEESPKMFERLQIASVQLDFEGWLGAVPREGTLTDDQSHGVSQIEAVHGQ